MNNCKQILNNLILRYPILKEIKDQIYEAYLVLEESFQQGHQLFLAGNGGSAADSEHISGELMKSFNSTRSLSENEKKELLQVDSFKGKRIGELLEKGLPAYPLQSNSALVTAIANDIGEDMIFAQQLYNYSKKGDTFLAISTSGNSKNIINAVIVAKAKSVKIIGLTGKSGGELSSYADVTIKVPETETFKIQELHLPIYHALCLMLEQRFFNNNLLD